MHWFYEISNIIDQLFIKKRWHINKTEKILILNWSNIYFKTNNIKV